jgi:hypothetical protein
MSASRGGDQLQNACGIVRPRPRVLIGTVFLRATLFDALPFSMDFTTKSQTRFEGTLKDKANAQDSTGGHARRTLTKHFGDNFSAHDRRTLRPTVVEVGQIEMVQSECVQNRGMDVMHMHGALDRA